MRLIWGPLFQSFADLNLEHIVDARRLGFHTPDVFEGRQGWQTEAGLAERGLSMKR